MMISVMKSVPLWHSYDRIKAMIRFYYAHLNEYTPSSPLPHPLYHHTGLCLLEKGLSDLGVPGNRFSLSYGIHGKPFLTNEPNLHFSISHAGAYVVCALSDQNIGADILDFRKNQRILSLAERFFSSENLRLLQQAAKEELPPLFFRLFCAAESYTKLIGDGLSQGMKDFYMDQALLHVYDHRRASSVSGYLTEPFGQAGYACFLCTHIPLAEDISCIPVFVRDIL
jgi:4'-phosphopantetheinyl transferase psf-1